MGFEVLKAIPGNEVVTLLVTARENPHCTVQHSLVHRGNSAPTHYHERDHEAFYLHSGRVRFAAGNAGQHAVEAGPGVLVVAPPYCARSFEALEDSVMIVVNNPSGPGEEFMRGLADLPSLPPPEAFVARANGEMGIHPLEVCEGADVPPTVRDLGADGPLEIGGLVYSHGTSGGDRGKKKLMFACDLNDSSAHCLSTNTDHGAGVFCVSLA